MLNVSQWKEERRKIGQREQISVAVSYVRNWDICSMNVSVNGCKSVSKPRRTKK